MPLLKHDPSKHPRYPKGTIIDGKNVGGKFMPKDGSQSAIGKNKPVRAIAAKLAQTGKIKAVDANRRLMNAVARELKAARSTGEELDQKALRRVGQKAIAKEVRRIAEGKPELGRGRRDTSAPSTKSIGGFSSDFEKAYKEERRFQEIKGVVAIKREQIKERMKEKGYTDEEFNKGYEYLKSRKLFFSVREKDSDLISLDASTREWKSTKGDKTVIEGTKKTASTKNKKLNQVKFSSDFEKIYKSIRKIQELKGVVAIEREQVKEQMVKKGYTEEEFDKGYQYLRSKGLIFAVQEKNSELINWNE